MELESGGSGGGAQWSKAEEFQRMERSTVIERGGREDPQQAALSSWISHSGAGSGSPQQSAHSKPSLQFT